MTGLSSRPRPDDWAGPWLQLARDDDPEGTGDVTAGGALHWAPPGHAGLRERMAQLAAWIVTYAPRLLVVDVSVEVAVLARTMGVPTIVMGMPGAREDYAHQLGYRLADAIIAPWPEWAGVLRGAGAVRGEAARGRRDLALRRPRHASRRRADGVRRVGRPVRTRRHGAHARHARRRPAREPPAGPGPCSARRRTAGSTTPGRCSAPPT